MVESYVNDFWRTRRQHFARKEKFDLFRFHLAIRPRASSPLLQPLPPFFHFFKEGRRKIRPNLEKMCEQSIYGRLAELRIYKAPIYSCSTKRNRNPISSSIFPIWTREQKSNPLVMRTTIIDSRKNIH